LHYTRNRAERAQDYALALHDRAERAHNLALALHDSPTQNMVEQACMDMYLRRHVRIMRFGLRRSVHAASAFAHDHCYSCLHHRWCISCVHAYAWTVEDLHTFDYLIHNFHEDINLLWIYQIHVRTTSSYRTVIMPFPLYVKICAHTP